MSKTIPIRIMRYVFLTAAMMLLAGCAGTSGLTADQGSGIAGDPDQTFESESGAELSAGQNDPEIEASTQEAPVTGIPDTADPDWQYSWQEITVTLPADWKDRCVIQEDPNGFSIFQKASHEENNDGFICGFMRTSDYLNYGVGETLLTYTDSGLLYYLMRPTDFACASGNKEVADEYSRMCTQAEDLADSLQINVSDGIHYDAREYVLPISSIFPLTRENLLNLTDNELWIARNEIFARHGRMFTNEYLQLRFESCTWYQGTTAPEQFDESVLTRTEQDNIQLLIAAEEEYDRQHPYPRQYKTTETAVEDLSGSGTFNRITYQVSQESPRRCELTIDGKSYDMYDLNNYFMDSPHPDVFYITDIVESDDFLEIALLDLGPSFDLVTHFFRYDGVLSYIGTVGGWPFVELNSGINGFNGSGWITGKTRTDLIHTSYPEGYWRYDFTQNQIVCQETRWHPYFFVQAHILYEDLPVHRKPDSSSETIFISADTEIYFLSTDLKEWILIKGKNGDMGYMQVADEKIVDLDKPATEVISDLYLFD